MKGDDDVGAGAREVTVILAVDVGDRCKVMGCGGCAAASGVGVNAGLGSARTCDRKFNSRNWAWSSITIIILLARALSGPMAPSTHSPSQLVSTVQC